MVLESMITIKTTCPFCRKKGAVAVWSADYAKWAANNAPVQDAFPYLSANERESLMTGICSNCWDSLFSASEEEEEEE